MYYDLAVIGAGWAGFNACLKAKKMGLKPCLIEAAQIGGTCLNRGCIPTKALIQSAKIYALLNKSSNFGIENSGLRVDFTKIQERKNKIIRQLSEGMLGCLSGIDFIQSRAEITAPNKIKVEGREIESKFILIATGSRSVELPGLPFDGKKIFTSDQILALTEIPASLLIVGGGVIGCEFASLFATLGSQVTIVEKLPFLLPGEDKEATKKIEVVFKKKGIKVNTGADALKIDLNVFTHVLVCVGRVPETGGLGLEKIGVKLERGKIIVDDYLQSSVANIYAAGDCTGRLMLAHFAAYQGELAVDNIVVAQSRRLGELAVPACIFTDPEIASVGLNEEKALQAGLNIQVHKFDFLGSGMARIMDETTGFIKIISNRQTDEVIGATIIGPKATELIAILTEAVWARLKISQMRQMIFAHPTLAESLHESIQS